MPSNGNEIDAQIQARVEEFTADLSDLIRQAALEAVHEALAGGAPAAPGAGGRRGKRRTTKKRATRARAGKKRSTKKKAGRRRRQSDAQVSKLSASVVGALQEQPQQSISELADGIGVTSADLKRPIAELLDAKQIKKKGQRRGTRYSAA